MAKTSPTSEGNTPAPSQTPQVTVNTHSVGEIGARPSPFDGNRANSEDFVIAVRMFLRTNKKKYDTDENKIALFLTLCTGSEIAKKWTRERNKEILEDDETSIANPKHTTRFATFNQLLERFNRDFKPLDAGADARRSLKTLQMGDRPVTDYITEFETIAPVTGYNDVALIDFFKAGLHPALKTSCTRVIPLPKTLDVSRGYSLT